MTLATNLVTFGRLLRRAGLAVTPESTRLFTVAIEVVGWDRRDRVRAAGRAIYTKRREDAATFDRAFAMFWRRYGSPTGDAPELPRLRQDDTKPPTFPAESPPTDLEGEPPPPIPEPALTSEAERLAKADFASLTAAEAADALTMLKTIRPRLPTRSSRRWVQVRHRGRRPASAAMLRAALATGGETVAWKWRDHPRRPRPIVLVTDISGSMERYSRLLLRFAHALGQSGAPIEVFVFGTRLTRITRELRVRDPDAALARVGASVVDWNGGTRIGESLHELNQRWVRRTIRSGAIVLLASDGWERGDPEQLAVEMARLSRSCYRLYWLDPLASHEGFAPEVQGLKAALPHIDALLPCASVASLTDLANRLVTATALGRRPFNRSKRFDAGFAG